MKLTGKLFRGGFTLFKVSKKRFQGLREREFCTLKSFGVAFEKALCFSIHYISGYVSVVVQFFLQNSGTSERKYEGLKRVVTMKRCRDSTIVIHLAYRFNTYESGRFYFFHLISFTNKKIYNSLFMDKIVKKKK